MPQFGAIASVPSRGDYRFGEAWLAAAFRNRDGAKRFCAQIQDDPNKTGTR